MAEYRVTIRRVIMAVTLVEANTAAEARRVVERNEWADLEPTLESDLHTATKAVKVRD